MTSSSGHLDVFVLPWLATCRHSGFLTSADDDNVPHVKTALGIALMMSVEYTYGKVLSKEFPLATTSSQRKAPHVEETSEEAE
jgi:hypothetical protein